MKRLSMIMLALAFIVVSVQAQKTYVLLTGINNYGMEEEANLKYPVKDVKELKQVFKNQKYTVASLTGKYVTPQNIQEKLDAIIKLARPADRIIFFFSGHGGSGAVACYQGAPLFYNDLVNMLSKAKTNQIFCFIDACHSGSALSATLAGNANLNGAKPVFITACRPEETSADMALIENGLFTQAVLKGLRGKADENRDRMVTLVELFKYVHRDIASKMTRFPADAQMHPQLIGSTSLYNTVIAKW
jgi:uncharacterized caspase-like protein